MNLNQPNNFFWKPDYLKWLIHECFSISTLYYFGIQNMNFNYQNIKSLATIEENSMLRLNVRQHLRIKTPNFRNKTYILGIINNFLYIFFIVHNFLDAWESKQYSLNFPRLIKAPGSKCTCFFYIAQVFKSWIKMQFILKDVWGLFLFLKSNNKSSF